jgi:hypothetical protein
LVGSEIDIYPTTLRDESPPVDAILKVNIHDIVIRLRLQRESDSGGELRLGLAGYDGHPILGQASVWTEDRYGERQ